MAAYGLYSQIESNKRRSIILLVGLFGLIYLLVYAGALVAEAMSYPASLSYLLRKAWSDLLAAAPLATVGTAIWIVIAYYFHQSMIDAVTGGREVTRAEEPRLYNLLENLCISRGITMPKLKVMDSDALNAFATGMNEKQYAITVTTALLGSLDDAEIEAVLGHELTHIRNGDVRMLVVAVIMAGGIAFFAELFFRLWFNFGGSFRSRRSDGEERGKGGNIVAIVIGVALVAVAWLLSSMIRFALSRSREYLADAGSVELTKNPDAMISALRKIEGRGELAGATSAVMEMCVDNPREEFTDLFSTHPPIDARIKALVDLMGGHDPRPLALPGPKETDETQAQSQELPGTAPRGLPPQGPWGGTQDGTTPFGVPPGSSPQPAGPWSEPAAPNAPTVHGGPEGTGGGPDGTGSPASRPFLPDRPPIDLGAATPSEGGAAGPWGKPGGRT
jgi:heat shock protein HtpX